MVTSELVTMPAVMRLIASMGSSEGKYSMSTSMDGLPVIFSVVVPTPSISTPSICR